MAPNAKMSIQKFQRNVVDHKDHNHKDEKKEHGEEDRYSSELQKAHPTDECNYHYYVIVKHS